jgi:hypothetical protein
MIPYFKIKNTHAFASERYFREVSMFKEKNTMQSQRMQTNKHAIRLHTLYAGGLIAVSLIMLQGFLGLGKLDIPAFISVLAFAAAIPLLAGILVINVIERRYPYSSPGSKSVKIVENFFYLGILIDLVGIASTFWHISFIAGIIFIVMAVISGLVYSIYIFNLSEAADL